MEQAFAQHSDSLRSRCFRDRWPIVAAVAVQALVAIYLCHLKWVSVIDPPPGGKYFVIFYHLLATLDWVGALLGLMFLIGAFLLPPQRWVDDVAGWLGRHVRLVAVGVAVGLAGMSIVVHQAYPLTMDEYAPFFQSQVFARGRLAGQWPPQLSPLLVSPVYVGTFLEMSRVTGQACSGYWPGHAILLTPFTFLGIPWAFNPVLAGCAIPLLAAIVRRSFGERAVGWAVLFTLASPVFAAYGVSFYAMMAHFTLNLLFAWLLLSPTVPRVAGAGLVGGFALALHNPFPHFVFAMPWLGWLTLRRDRWTRLPVIALCYATVFLPLEVGWRHVKEAIHGNRQATLFVAAAGVADAAAGQPPVADAVALPPGATPAAPAAPAGGGGVSAFVATIASYLAVIEFPSLDDLWWGRFSSFLRLVAWDAPGLVVLACWGFWRNRHSTPARLFALSGLTTFLGYALIAMSGGHGWGYRYFFSAWSCLPLLAAGLATDHSGGEQAGSKRDGPGQVGSRQIASPLAVLRAVGLAAVLSLAICLPVRLWQIHAFIADHRAQLPPTSVAKEFSPNEIVVFVDKKQGYFRSDLIRNDPFFERGPFMFVSTGLGNDTLAIAEIAKAAGMQARMTHADDRGSAWVLQPAPTEESAQ